MPYKIKPNTLFIHFTHNALSTVIFIFFLLSSGNAFAEEITSEVVRSSPLIFSTTSLWLIITIISFALVALSVFTHKVLQEYEKLKASLDEKAKLLNESKVLVVETKENAKKEGHEKIEFMARISHEIRTPMNGVLGMAEALSFSELSSHQRTLLTSLNDSAKSLLSLLNDVLDFSKIDAGKLTLEQLPTRLQSLTGTIVKNFRHLIHQKMLTLNLNIDESLQHNYHTDPTRLTQVLNNLLDNAIKFTDKGVITVAIEKLDTNETNSTLKNPSVEHLKFSVTDAGIGITKQQQEDLFSPFIQADEDTTRKFGGTGLGLTICQEIVHAMGSEITIDSVIGEGSCFSFVLALPIAPTEWKEEERRKNERTVHPEDDNRFNNVRVLVVEDNIVNVAVITAQLERLNVHADVANDGVEALAMHEESKYNIIISDCHMPNMDGFELAKQITKQPNNDALWLIAITADMLNGAKEKCFSAGFDDYLTKPCTQENVNDIMNNAYRKIQHHLN